MTTLREAAQQALEAMGSVGADWVCEASHHAKKDQHKWGDPCPLQQRWHVAYQALRAALAEPVQEPVASAGLGPLPEPAQPAEPEAYMPGCRWPLPATPDYYTAEQMREYALRALAETQEPVAIVGTQADTWKGYEGQWLPPGPPIKTVHMLRELPEGTLLYTVPPQRPAEPVQEPDSPQRRCGGPGCDGTCCQPVQEPVGAVLVNRESREGVMFYSVDMIPDPSTLKDRFELVPVYTSPPQRKPLSEDEIFAIENDIPDDVIGDRAWTICFARAVERAHGIGGEA